MVYRHHSDPYIMYASSLFKGTYHVMGSVEQLLVGNATSITLLHYQLIDLLRSPRGTVLRIEALALVAIALSFFLAIFGSCRRWSNRWIIQKGLPGCTSVIYISWDLQHWPNAVFIGEERDVSHMGCVLIRPHWLCRPSHKLQWP